MNEVIILKKKSSKTLRKVRLSLWMDTCKKLVWAAVLGKDNMDSGNLKIDVISAPEKRALQEDESKEFQRN